MMRPELLQHLREFGLSPALSADAFSRWGVTCPLVTTENHDFGACDRCAAFCRDCNEIRAAMILALRDLVPAFAAWLHGRLSADTTDSLGVTASDGAADAMLGCSLSAELHARGLSVRHLALVRARLPANSRARPLLLLDMFARVLKNELRHLLRQQTYALAARTNRSGMASFHSLGMSVVGVLNMLSGCHPGGAAVEDEFWQQLHRGLKERFGALAVVDVPTPAALRTELTVNMAPALLTAGAAYALRAAGFKLRPEAEADCQGRIVGVLFAISDLEDAPARVKHMVDLALGRQLVLQAAAIAGTTEGV